MIALLSVFQIVYLIKVFAVYAHTFNFCKEYPSIEVTTAFATIDRKFYVFTKRYYSRISSFGPVSAAKTKFSETNKLNGLFDEQFFYPEIDDGFPKRIADDWRIESEINAGFTFDGLTYLLSGNYLWSFNNTRPVNTTMHRNYFAFLNHSRTVNAIEYVSRSNRLKNGTFYVSIPYRSFLDLLFTFEGNSSQVKHHQINVEIDAIALIYSDDSFANGVVFTNYSFNYFSGYWNANDQFSTYPILQGFLYPNELFFACPQIFCFAADVDTVLLDNNDIGYVFRGKHCWKWYPSRMLTVKDAKLISSVFNGLPDYLDATFIDNNEVTFIFKNDKVYKSDAKPKLNYILEGSLYQTFAGNLNAIWFHRTKDTVYFFKGTEIQRHDLTTNETVELPISDFLGIPGYIDAAFNVRRTGKSFILKRSFYYEFDASYIRNRYFVAQVSFDTLFGCNKNYNYSKLGYRSYAHFASRMSEFAPIPAMATFRDMHRLNSNRSFNVETRYVLLFTVLLAVLFTCYAFVNYKYVSEESV